MEIRHPLHPDHGAILDTEELRSHFLIDKVFVPGEISLTYSHVDRIIIGGICPLEIPLSFDESIGKQIGSNYLLERRELGVINLGTGTGKVVADGSEYLLEPEEALYLGLGIKDIEFSSVDATKPAMFYMASAPAHKNYPTKKITKDDVIKEDLGTQENCNVRTIHKYFVPDVLPTCQLCLGLTRLAPGSNWNTMPTHTHERRMEVYFYMDMDEDSVVFHMMGEPTETRHIVMRNHQAVISPSWSIHSGVGTKNYAFIWAMIGENQVFGDMDFVDMKDLR